MLGFIIALSGPPLPLSDSRDGGEGVCGLSGCAKRDGKSCFYLFVYFEPLCFVPNILLGKKK